jgi:hypothetical protein
MKKQQKTDSQLFETGDWKGRGRVNVKVMRFVALLTGTVLQLQTRNIKRLGCTYQAAKNKEFPVAYYYYY